MFDPSRLERISLTDLLDSPEQSIEFNEEFAAQFVEIPAWKFAPPSTRSYVNLEKFVKSASSLVFLISAYSLILWSVSGFALTHPLFSALTMIATATYYMMGVLLKHRQQSK